MKNIIFTIHSSCGEEQFFLVADDSLPIDEQIDDALADICFCDAYEIASYEEVDEPYAESRRQLINIYQSFCGESVCEAFCSGAYTTRESILLDICHEMKVRMEKEYQSLCKIRDLGIFDSNKLAGSSLNMVNEIGQIVKHLETLDGQIREMNSEPEHDTENEDCDDSDAWRDGSEIGCGDCPADACNGHCMSCSYRSF